MDELQIYRIFINLIKNAVQAGVRHIVIEAEEERADGTKVRVGNDGIPTTPENQQQIFIPFFSTKSVGMGIGLSQSRQIM